MDAHSLSVRPISSHRVLVPGMAVEITKKGLSPSSTGLSHMASGGQDAGVRHPPCLLPVSQQPLGNGQISLKKHFFFSGEKREKEKKEQKEREYQKKKINPKTHLCNG